MRLDTGTSAGWPWGLRLCVSVLTEETDLAEPGGECEVRLTRGREDFFGAFDICGTCDLAAGVRSGQVVRL